jgi:hypothetical protein
MSDKKKKSSNLKLAGIFLVIVFGLISFSIIFKIFLVIKNSKFDGSNRFTVGFTAKYYSKIESFSPKDKTISIIIVNGNLKKQTLSDFLEVPVDVNVKTDEENNLSVNTDLLNSLIALNRESNLNTFDAFKLLLFSKLSGAKIVQKVLITNSSQSQIQDATSNLLIDSQVINENKNIEIINATDTYGLGSRFAMLITNMGGNVILVSTSDTISKNSKVIYYQTKSYTAEKIGEVLKIPLEQTDKKSVSDVIIIIGEDKVKAQ